MLTRRVILTAPFIASSAFAQWQPKQNIKVIVPYPAGGPTDAVGRIVAKELADGLNATVIVENKAGASGSIGTRDVAKAESDGYTLLLGNNQTLGSNEWLVKERGYDSLNDFRPILGLAELQQAVIVRKDLPVNTLQEFIAYGKAQGDKMNYGSTGIGSGSHLAMELFKKITGITPTHIPFRGAAQLAVDLLAGRIDSSIATLASALGQVQAGELKCLGIASLQRAPQLPEVKRLNEQGVEGADSDSWLCFMGQAKMPDEIANRMTSILSARLKNPEVQAALLKVGAVPNLREPAAFKAYHAAEVKKWGEVIQAAGVKAE